METLKKWALPRQVTLKCPPGGEGYFSESNIKLKSSVMGNTKQGSIRLTLFCENYYFTKKITNLRRKLLICEKSRVKVQISNLRKKLLICEEKITNLRRKSGVKVQKGAVKVQITNLRR